MFLSELAENPFSRFLGARIVAEGEEKVAGYCCFWTVFDEVHLMNLAVAPRWRRRGVGSRLLEEIISEGRRQGAGRICLEVRRSGAAARALYEKFGFKVTAVRRRYYERPVEDALLMVLDLGRASSDVRHRSA